MEVVEEFIFPAFSLALVLQSSPVCLQLSDSHAFLCFSGYEKYNSMRADSALCFLERVGMPDAKAIAAEQRGTDVMADGVEG